MKLPPVPAVTILKTRVIPALGHNLSTTVIEPTCTENGLKIATCSLCGFTSSESLPALGHEWTYTVTEPTCTQEGSNTMVLFRLS